MFTVRHRCNGSDVLFQAETLIAQSEWLGIPNKGNIVAIEFYNADHTVAHEPILFGTIYVMNENGKTVANYDLGQYPMPQNIAYTINEGIAI